MEKLKIDIALIGGGIAAITFAENYKRFNPDATIAIFEKTSNSPYSKVLLPHYVKKIIPREKVFIRTEKQLKERGINYLKDQQVQPIDVENKVFVSNNFQVTYNKLIIATGGEAKTVNSFENSFYLQTLEDADKLTKKLKQIQSNKQAIVIGGGFVSFEFFEIFKKYQLNTTSFIKSSGFFPKLSPFELTPIITSILKNNSIEAKDISLVNETKNPFIAGVATGITRTHIFFGTEQEGVPTNGFLESDYKDIYAVGDVAIVTKNNIPRITGNWNNAIQQGIWLAKYLSNQINSEYSFNRATDYTTTLFGNHLSFIGNTDQSVVNNKITLSNEKQFISECYLNDKLVGAILLNSSNLRSFYQEKVNLITG